MDLKDVAAVSGKGGLFKVLKPTRTGVILESIDETKNKFIASANHRVSLLKEISIYTTGKEASVPLEEVFTSIFKKFGLKINLDSKASNRELENFIAEVLPDYDPERVYPSDIKKMVAWYSIISQHLPEKFEESSPQAAEEEGKPKEKTVKKEKAETKTSEKKAKAKPAEKK